MFVLIYSNGNKKSLYAWQKAQDNFWKPKKKKQTAWVIYEFIYLNHSLAHAILHKCKIISLISKVNRLYRNSKNVSNELVRILFSPNNKKIYTWKHHNALIAVIVWSKAVARYLRESLRDAILIITKFWENSKIVEDFGNKKISV